MIRLLRWVILKLGWRTTLAGLLLAAALGVFAFGLHDLVRGLDAGLALFAALLGMALGWLLAYSPLPGWLAGLLTTVLGVEVLFIRVGQLGGKIAAVLGATVGLVAEIAAWPPRGAELAPLAHAGAQLWDAALALAGRCLDWTRALIGGTPAFDPAAVALVWGLAICWIAAWAAWATFRRAQPLAALFPAIAFLAVMLAYAAADPLYLLPIVTVTLLLMVSIRYSARERDWERGGIGIAEDIPADLAVVAVPLTLVLTLAAALTPSISLQDLLQWTRRIEVPVGEANRLPDSLGLAPIPRATTIFDAVRAPGLPRRHLLGAGQELDRRIVMTVQTDDGRAAGYYWRSSTYDLYNGRGWTTSATETTAYRAGQPAVQAGSAGRIVRQRIQAYENLGGLLIAAGTVVSADHDYQIAWRTTGDAFSASIPGQAYEVESSIPSATEAELRAAGSAYPAWVRDHYLLPLDGVPERVLTQARDLTATAPTPYDRARAIESYLRQIPYTLDVPAPPPNRDVVDYYLNDLRRGYCDYAASAMVVLARAAGLPARLVVGYASGAYDEENTRYIVTEADAHSWVDIYFPTYGWMEFEPTGGRPALDRSGTIPGPDRKVGLPQLPGVRPAGYGLNWPGLLGSGLGLVILAGLVGLGIDEWRLRHLAPKEAVAAAYTRMAHLGRRMGIPVRSADTPAELAVWIEKWLAPGQPGTGVGGGFARASREVFALTELYVILSYSDHPVRPADGARAIELWSYIRRRFWLVFLGRRAASMWFGQMRGRAPSAANKQGAAGRA